MAENAEARMKPITIAQHTGPEQVHIRQQQRERRHAEGREPDHGLSAELVADQATLSLRAPISNHQELLMFFDQAEYGPSEQKAIIQEIRQRWSKRLRHDDDRVLTDHAQQGRRWLGRARQTS